MVFGCLCCVEDTKDKAGLSKMERLWGLGSKWVLYGLGRVGMRGGARRGVVEAHQSGMQPTLLGPVM